jgi:hypothetical protein
LASLGNASSFISHAANIYTQQTLMHAILKYFPKFGGSAEEAAI